MKQDDFTDDTANTSGRILEAAERYGTNDISVVTNAYAHETRVRSYELVAAAFALTTRQGGVC